jgi:integrase
LSRPLPRFVRTKILASGGTAFYWDLTGYYRRLGCSIPGEPLGTDYIIACGEDGNGGRAAALNGLFDEWKRAGAGEPAEGSAKFGTVDWLFREYKQTKAYLEKVSSRSRRDYERTMLLITDLVTKKGDRLGDRQVKALTPVSADKIYELVATGPHGPRPRQGEKVVGLCARAWSVVHRLYPNVFNKDIPNPWRGVTKNRRTKATKPAATRDQVYAFANAAIQRGYPEAAAAAIICFEWLQRPENVLAGYIRWTDYRGREAPTAIRIFHHKTGAVVLHPLQDSDGTLFYADAEDVLAKAPRRGIPMILHETRSKTEPGKPKPTKLYSESGMAKLVRRLRKEADLPPTFTLDACRHGGMTELEEAELTDGQGRALSAHKSRAYEGYAKRTMERALAATRKRHAHRVAASSNAQGTEFRNEGPNEFRNDHREPNVTDSK